MALAFVQNSNYVYYPRKLTAAQTTAFSGGPSTWPKAAVDCEPQNEPGLVPLPGAEPRPRGCDRQLLRRAADLRPAGQGRLLRRRRNRVCAELRAGVRRQHGFGHPAAGCADDLSHWPAVGTLAHALPRWRAARFPIPGGASNALVDTSTMYVVGQQPQTVQGQTLFAGELTVVNLPTILPSGSPIVHQRWSARRREPHGLADDNTLWIGMTKCTNGVRAATGLPYGCLTMFNTSTEHGDHAGALYRRRDRHCRGDRAA